MFLACDSVWCNKYNIIGNKYKEINLEFCRKNLKVSYHKLFFFWVNPHLSPWKCHLLSDQSLNQFNESKTPPMYVLLVKCIQNINLLLTAVWLATSTTLLAFHAGRDLIAYDNKHCNGHLCPLFSLLFFSSSSTKLSAILISPLPFSKLIPKLNLVWIW